MQTTENATLWAFLVSPDGRWLAEDSAEFLAALGDRKPDYDAPMFAVRNLGFVRIRRYDLLLETTLHPAAAALEAVDAVIPILSSSGASFYKIKYLCNEWQEELMRSWRSAAARLAELALAGEPV